MAIEIERKFLVVDSGWQDHVRSASRFRQGYLSRENRASVRVRLVDSARAFLTIKAAKAGFSRHEYEYAIPIRDGEELLEFCSGHLIEKTRHLVEFGGRMWEIDVFDGLNAGLVIAEVELPDESAALTVPNWVGREITADHRYYNAALAKVPFSRW